MPIFSAIVVEERMSIKMKIRGSYFCWWPFLLRNFRKMPRPNLSLTCNKKSVKSKIAPQKIKCVINLGLSTKLKAIFTDSSERPPSPFSPIKFANVANKVNRTKIKT